MIISTNAFIYSSNFPFRLNLRKSISSSVPLHIRPFRTTFLSKMVPGAHRIRPTATTHGDVHVATENTPLMSADPNAPVATPVTWPQIWTFARPYVIPLSWRLRLVATFSILCVLSRKLISLLPPYAFKLAVDTLATNIVNDTSVIPFQALIIYIFARILSSLLNALQSLSYTFVSADSTRRFSVDIFQHLQNLSLAFHLQRKTGEITRIMDRGVNSIDTLANTVLFTLFPTLFEAVLVTAIFVRLGTPSIAITTAITVITYFAFTIAFTSWRLKLRRRVIDAENAVSGKAVDTLINYETVKMFGMEQEEVSAYDRFQRDYQDKYIVLRLSLNSLNFGQGTIQTLGLGIAVIFAAMAAASGRFTPGDFVLVNTYVMQLFQPLFFLGSTYRIITQSVTDLEKCFNLFNERITVQDSSDASHLDMSEEDVVEGRVGKVCFQNVSFKYHGNERGSSGGLKNVSLSIAPGKMVAIVGASGAGKSTIMRLLLRFYNVDSGSVLIDGVDIRSLTQTSLRKKIGVVAQDTVLFNSTLRDNIAYGKPEASDAEIMAAARYSAMGKFIESLPLGLDTVVGERGVRLSGGERQRVGCARCIIKNPVIVLLDEATSSLDTQTEREMQANLREVCKNRTTLVVAHRLSTIMMADEIIVLGKDPDGTGSIIERGSHEQLLAKETVYAEMWKVQTSVEEDKKDKTKDERDD